MQADIRSVDAEETGLDYRRFHEAYEQGTLRSPVSVARLIYWIVGPWGRNHNGEIFEAGNAEWTAQVEKDIVY
jgi:hypothetical protein